MNQSVWNQIETDAAKAEVLEARSLLMINVSQKIESWDVTQAEAAKRLGVTRPRISDLMRGEFAKFNFETLYEMAIKAGMKVSIRTSTHVDRKLVVAGEPQRNSRVRKSELPELASRVG